jgi:hypothetical protein
VNHGGLSVFGSIIPYFSQLFNAVPHIFARFGLLLAGVSVMILIFVKTKARAPVGPGPFVAGG